MLSLNISKTVFINFTNKINEQPNNYEIYINNIKLKQVNFTKYLGVTVDQHMRWELHITKITKKLRYLLIVFHKLKNLLRRSSLLTIYYGLFHSRATYGIIAWGGAYESVIENLSNLQSRVLKIVSGTNKSPLSMTKTFYLEALNPEYNYLSNLFNPKKSITKYKSLTLTKIKIKLEKKVISL